MIRDEETLNILLDSIARFVREVLVPNEALVAETDAIPPAIVAQMRKSHPQVEIGPGNQGVGGLEVQVGGDLSVLQHQDPVGDRADQRQIMGDEEH